MVKIYNNGKVSELRPESLPARISELLNREKIAYHADCGGRGSCGKCRVYASGDISPVSEKEKKFLAGAPEGMRLACIAEITGENAEIRMPDEGEVIGVTAGVERSFEVSPWGKNLGYAVDIGTTTVAGYLYDLKSGYRLAEKAVGNPQSAFGADVISRMEKSMAGQSKALAESIRGCVSDLAVSLCDMAGRDPKEIDAAVITGNTAMLYLLHGYDVKEIAFVPFEASHTFGGFEPAGDFYKSLSPECRVFYPSCISAYVGADITCAILASDMCLSDEPILLADIGTNGELALYDGKELLCCATAAGPAFEGAGIEMGSRAMAGAIDSVSIVNGKLNVTSIGSVAPKTICGSGLMDAIGCLVDLEEIDETGMLDDEEYFLADTEVKITRSDIRAFQLAKAAIRAGEETLIHTSGLDSSPQLYIAGGFGSSLDPHSAGRVGLIRPDMAPSCRSLGNAAGAGAVRLLLSEPEIEKSRILASEAKLIELATDPWFTKEFMEMMYFD